MQQEKYLKLRNEYLPWQRSDIFRISLDCSIDSVRLFVSFAFSSLILEGIFFLEYVVGKMHLAAIENKENSLKRA